MSIEGKYQVRLFYENKKPILLRSIFISIKDGAGDGNRTRVATLGRSSSTIEPHLHLSTLYKK